MIEIYPQTNQWVTFFLYPFRFPVETKEELRATLEKMSSRWQESKLSSQQDLEYFLPYTRNFLTSQIDHFKFNLPEDAALEVSDYADLAPKLTKVRLHLLPMGIGILSLRVEEATSRPFGRLLDFNSDFRYLTKAYETQELPQTTLRIGQQCISEDAPSAGLDPLIRYFLQEIGEAPESQLLDNRLIVYSYAALDRDSLPPDYDLDELFFKFLFVDRTTEALPDVDFRRELLSRHEYRRWRSYVHDGSPQSVRFGFSRYSGVVMGLESGFFSNLIFRHFQTVYYGMVLILLFHRTALLKLSAALSEVRETNPQKRRNEVRRLREQVLEFTNRYWFGEITNQDQGIEMFDCWKTALRNQELFDEVHTELQEYDDELRNRDTDQLNNMLAILTVGTYLFLPLALTTYVLAILDESYRGPLFLPLLLAFFIAASVILRKSTTIGRVFRDLSNPDQALGAVSRQYWQQFKIYVQQWYKRMRHWQP